MTGKEYQMLSERTINHSLSNEERELHALHGMVAEIGEIHSLYQKEHQGHHDSNFTVTRTFSELGDLLWFISEWCSVYGVSLDDVMEHNIEKLKRRYPNGFETERSIHREEGDI